MPRYDYPRPALTTDVALFAGDSDALYVLLVRRRFEPFAGMWALPGGFVEQGERIEAAARRELAEETGIDWDAPLVQLATYGDPGRDPRGWTVTVVWAGHAGPDRLNLVAGDDAAAAAWHHVSHVPSLAFDHARILADALRELPLRGVL